MNRWWDKEQNMKSCYQLDELGLPWQQFEDLWWWKSELRPPRNVWKVARMKDYIMLNGHRKFCEIQPENKALKLIWSCRHDEDSAEILGKPSKKFRMWETLTLLMCADSRTKINHIRHGFFCTFRHFFHLLGLFCFVANEEVACHSQDYLKLCVAFWVLLQLELLRFVTIWLLEIVTIFEKEKNNKRKKCDTILLSLLSLLSLLLSQF